MCFQVDEDIYPEAYRKTKYVKGSNAIVCFQVDEDIYPEAYITERPSM